MKFTGSVNPQHRPGGDRHQTRTGIYLTNTGRPVWYLIYMTAQPRSGQPEPEYLTYDEIHRLEDQLDIEELRLSSESPTKKSLTGHKHPRDLEGDPESEDIDSPVKKKRKKKSWKSKNWFFTWNNYISEGDESVKKLLGMDHLVAYVVQEEDSGTKHLQGVLSFSKRKRFKHLKFDWPEVHWEVCKNLMAARNYCQKIDTRAGKTWIEGFGTGEEVIDPLRGKKLYKYQQRVLDIIEGPVDDRKLYWLWSVKGGIGKSALTKHLVLKHGAMIVGGSWKDALYAIGEALKRKKKIHTVIFDIPRSQGNKISYTGIESIKNGCCFSPKYESASLVFNSPHVLVFANQAPSKENLSWDRWVIYNLDDDRDLRHVKTQADTWLTSNKFYV